MEIRYVFSTNFSAPNNNRFNLDPVNLVKMKHYHLTGVAGVGMSALAQVLVAYPYEVTGSDRYYDQGADLEVIKKLRCAGIRFVPQNGSGLTKETLGLIVSTAIEKDNPDLITARQLGVPVIHRAEMLARLVQGKQTIAIAGTAGKTTVAGLVGWTLSYMDKNPSVVNGGAIVNWVDEKHMGNVRIGSPDLWVIEVDESDKSLLYFKPTWAVITNISKDHFELEEVIEIFRKFSGKVQKDIICGSGVPALIGRSEKCFGPIEKRKNGFVYKDVELETVLMGSHNIDNAFLATVLCERLGLSLWDIREALRAFKGIERRLEVVGEAGGVCVVDDYAHNPVKIQAAWTTVASTCQRVLGVWRPHGYAPLSMMMQEFVDGFVSVLRPKDRLFILPVYYAGGTTTKSVSSEDLVDTLIQCGLPVAYVPDYQTLFHIMRGSVKQGDTMLCMGARDPDLPLFARRLAHNGQI